MKRALTAAAVSLGAGLLVAGVGAPALAAPSPDWNANPAIPQTVEDSVHGGTGAKNVANLDQTNPDGTANRSAAAAKKVAGTTFGDPVRYVFLEPVPGSTAKALSPEDFSVVSYAAVQYVDGAASNVLVVDESGEFVQLGWPFEDIKDMVHVRPSEMLASGGPDGDLYEVSNNLMQVRPLNEVARSIIGTGAMPVETFRDVKAKQMAARAAEYDKEYQAAIDSGQIHPGDDLLGNPGSFITGAPPAGTTKRPTVSTPGVIAGALLTLGAGYLLVREVRRRRTSSSSL
ncbi:hypothetical protein [Xylanimonas sp. McL0601]|uniref:hypothetical protein n=1 Tax=Xylanimonas sp. McL0601 TaxID=3414739 RepID=UPI003CF40260